MNRGVLLGAATVVAAGIAAAVALPLSTPSSSPASTSGQYCGTERAAVKHLTDGFVPSTPPVVMTIPELDAMSAPSVTASSARLPQERTLVELDGVHLIAAKQESDSDLHLIVATPTGAELNVEAPMAVCDATSPWAAELSSARAAADAALGSVSGSAYTAENLTVTVEGILFFDVLHGQRGAANGVELHPLTYFALGSAPTSPPVVTTSPAVTTTPVATTTSVTTPVVTPGDDTVDELPGCATYPGRVYWHGRKQDRCRSSYFTTP